MSRLKSRSLGHLLRMCTEVMDSFYAARLLDISHQRVGISHLYRKSSAAYHSSMETTKQCYTMVGDGCFTYKSTVGNGSDITYRLDMNSQLCDCPAGASGKLCKHVYGCSTHFNIELLHLPPQTAHTRQMLARIASGSCEGLQFYSSLGAEPISAHHLSETTHSGDQANMTESEIPDATQQVTTSQEPSSASRTSPASCSRAECAAKYVRKISDAFLSVIGSEDADIPLSLLQALRKFAEASAKITTRTALEKLLFEPTLARYSRGRSMPVQPTSIARRKRPNGSRSQQIQGRTSTPLQLTSSVRPAKRQHCLKTAVTNNCMNARKH
jgi:hypothetical protein